MTAPIALALLISMLGMDGRARRTTVAEMRDLYVNAEPSARSPSPAPSTRPACRHRSAPASPDTRPHVWSRSAAAPRPRW